MKSTFWAEKCGRRFLSGGNPEQSAGAIHSRCALALCCLCSALALHGQPKHWLRPFALRLQDVRQSIWFKTGSFECDSLWFDQMFGSNYCQLWLDEWRASGAISLSKPAPALSVLHTITISWPSNAQSSGAPYSLRCSFSVKITLKLQVRFKRARPFSFKNRRKKISAEQISVCSSS